MKKIAVLGTGTAGILSLAHCLAFFPKEWEVVSINDPSIPILGIGESTSTQIPLTLFYATDLNFLEYSKELDLTIKHGVRYVNWREHEFFTKIPPPHYAIHFNNFSLKDFAFKRFNEKWKNRFSIIEGTAENIENLAEHVSLTVSNKKYTFDYLIDCRGFPKNSNEHIMIDTIPVNHCLVHTIKEPGTWKYTYHQAHENGWMFGIPLQTRQGWGYLYNDRITSKDDAIRDLSKIFNTELTADDLREFSFKNYKAKKFIDGRIIKNGNMALFYEPLEALSGWFYDMILRTFFDVAVTNQYNEDSANAYLHNLAKDYELFICYMYHNGSIFESDFWKITSKKCKEELEQSDKFKKHMAIMQQAHHGYYDSAGLVFSIGIWKNLMEDMKYHYFDR